MYINSHENINQWINTHDMALLYFSNKPCAVCRDLLPKLKELLKSYPLIAHVIVDTQNMPQISSEYGIFSAPAILLFISGKETLREAGIISLTELDHKLSRYYRLYFNE